MDFRSILQQAIIVDRMVNTEVSFEKLIPNIYHYPFSSLEDGMDKKRYLHLAGGGNIEVNLPFSFHFSSLDCLMFIYCERGGGRLQFQNKSISVTEGFFFVHDCRMPFTLQSLVLPWNFKIFFIQGEPQELFHSFLNASCDLPISSKDNPTIPMAFNRLISFPTEADIVSLLHMHRTITDLICLYCCSFLPAISSYKEALPSYLNEMKDYIDHHYMEPFSLSICEERLKINHYRLCREFSFAFGDPPLRYLNKKRIEIAKEMLLITEDSVQEISSKIGYESVTHFINQFKKRAGDTPQAFRRKAQAVPPAAHYPSQ